MFRTTPSQTSFTATIITGRYGGGVAAGIAYSEAGTVRAGMGTDAADYDDSGWQGLLIGNFTNESMALYHNDGSGLIYR